MSLLRRVRRLRSEPSVPLGCKGWTGSNRTSGPFQAWLRRPDASFLRLLWSEGACCRSRIRAFPFRRRFRGGECRFPLLGFFLGQRDFAHRTYGLLDLAKILSPPLF